MALVEARAPNTHAFYKAYLRDHKDGHVCLSWEGGWRNDEWVPVDHVRRVPSYNLATFEPKVGDEVEIITRAGDSEPFGLWRATVKKTRGGLFLIQYHGYDEGQSELVEKEVLRPVPQGVSFDFSSLHRSEIPVPESVRNNPHVSASSFDRLTSLSGAMTISIDHERGVLVITGSQESITKAKALAAIHFKHLEQMLKLQANKDRLSQALQKEKERIENGHTEEFAVAADLIGTVIGKNGSNIRKAQEIPGVESIKVENEKGIIRILGTTAEAARQARALLEILSERVPVPEKELPGLIGKGGSSIKEIEQASGCIRIRVDERPARDESKKGPRRTKAYDNATVDVFLVGTRDAVAAARMIIEEHLKFREEVGQLDTDLDDIKQELSRINAAFGLRRGRNNRQKKEEEGAAQPSESSASSSSAPVAESGLEPRKERRERRRKADDSKNVASD